MPASPAFALRYWNGLLLPLMVVQRKLLARNSAASDVASFPPWLDAMLHGMTEIERRLPFDFPARRLCAGHRGTTMNYETDLRYQVASTPERPAVGLSIVIPVYRGAATIGRLVEALSELRPVSGMELVLVNDGSPDNSDQVCQDLVRHSTVPITYVEHARNFGEHNAVMTGLRHVRGAYVITMDDDLQNPPEEVVRLYDHARLGNWDVVYTRYAVKQHAGWRNLGSRFANAVADRLLDKPKGLYLSSFRCMSALVVRSVTRYQGPYPYVDGLIMQVTQRIDSIEVRHLPRIEGRSNYNLVRLVRLWLNLCHQLLAGAAPAGNLRRRVHGAARRGGCGRHHRRSAFPARYAVRLGIDNDRDPAGRRRAIDDSGRPRRICRAHVPIGQRQTAGHGALDRAECRRNAHRGVTIYWTTLFAAIAASMAGQALLKAGAGQRNSWRSCWTGARCSAFALYGSAAILYIVALRRIPMSRALPCTAVSYVAAALIGHYAFGEPLGVTQITAIGLICGGVVILALA